MSWIKEYVSNKINTLSEEVVELVGNLADMKEPKSISPYIFMQIPKDEREGKLFIRLLEKNLNKKDWQMIKRGQKLKPEYTYKDFPHGYPNYACENYRIYFRRKERKDAPKGSTRD